MHYATKTSAAVAGPIELDTVAGIDRAIDVAIAAGDRDALNKLLALRRTKVGRPTSAAGKSELTRQMERMSAECRAIASAADQAKIASVLNGTDQRARRAAPSMCPECAVRLDELGDCWACQ